MKFPKIFAIDFDGVLCENRFPKIGRPNSELIEKLIFTKAKGHKLILWTCRTGEQLDAAVNWCKTKGLVFDAVNENLPEVVATFGSDTRKIFADVYIDDRNEVDKKHGLFPFIADQTMVTLRNTAVDLGLSCDDISHGTGIKPSRVEAYFKGEMTPSEATIERLSNYIGKEFEARVFDVYLLL